MFSELSLFLYDFADVWELSKDWWELFCAGAKCQERRWWESDSWGGGGGSSLARLCKCVGGSQE